LGLVSTFRNKADKYYLENTNDEKIGKESEDRHYYVAAKVFWVSEEAGARPMRPAIGQHVFVGNLC
jgi:hypothetical protein